MKEVDINQVPRFSMSVMSVSIRLGLMSGITNEQTKQKLECRTICNPFIATTFKTCIVIYSFYRSRSNHMSAGCTSIVFNYRSRFVSLYNYCSFFCIIYYYYYYLSMHFSYSIELVICIIS